MIISKLKLKNFMNIESCDLTFEEGINVIGGKNGNGKSAIFAAQAFCLTGAKRGDSWKDFIRIGSDKMTIDMTLYKYKGDEPMSFYIEGNSSSSSMIREIRYKDEYAKNADCDTLIEKYFDTDMMENVLFHLQDSNSITNITPAKRREILKKIFNSDFSNVLDIIKEDINSYKEKIKVNETKLQIFNNLKFEYQELLPLPQTDVEKINTDISDLEKFVESVRSTINVKNSEIQNIKKLQESLQADEVSVRTNKINYEKTIEAAKEYIAKSVLISDEEISQNENRVGTLGVEIAMLQTILNERNIEEQTKKELLSDLNSSCISSKTTIAGYKKQLDVFDTQSTCPTCGQECDKEHKNKIETLMSEIQMQLDIFTSKYNLLSQELQTMERDRKELTTKLTEHKEKLYKMESTITFQKKENERTQVLINEKQEWINTHTQKLKEVEVRYNEIKTALENIDTTMLEKLQNEVTIFITTEKEKQQETVVLKNKIKEIETILLLNKEKEKYNNETKNKEVENKQNVVVLNKDTDEMKKEIADLDYIKTIYDSELPNHIMMKACLFLQNGINNFMNTTKDNFQVKLQLTSKGIDFFYKARNESEWIKAKMASGFESAILTLSFKFTVALAYDTKYIIFDEPDKAADETSSVKLIKTIADVEGFDQIFITTHRPSALDYLKENGATILIADNGKYSNY